MSSGNQHAIALSVALSLLALPLKGAADDGWQLRGNIGLELQGFPQQPIHSADQQGNASLSGEIEIYRSLGSTASLTITPFAQLDANDEERTHFDFREFLITRYGDSYELAVGLGKVFWGVAESVNLVDIVNQRDGVKSFTADDKLGQPMIRLTLLPDWGEVDFLLLPGFRERTFPGVDGRPRFPLVVDTDRPRYESDKEDRHVDFAARVARTFGNWDIGLHVFHGTAPSRLRCSSNTRELAVESRSDSYRWRAHCQPHRACHRI